MSSIKHIEKSLITPPISMRANETAVVNSKLPAFASDLSSSGTLILKLIWTSRNFSRTLLVILYTYRCQLVPNF